MLWGPAESVGAVSTVDVGGQTRKTSRELRDLHGLCCCLQRVVDVRAFGDYHVDELDHEIMKAPLSYENHLPYVSDLVWLKGPHIASDVDQGLKVGCLALRFR